MAMTLQNTSRGLLKKSKSCLELINRSTSISIRTCASYRHLKTESNKKLLHPKLNTHTSTGGEAYQRIRRYGSSNTAVVPLIKCCFKSIGEGPHWDDATKTLVFVDILCGAVFRWNSITGQNDRHQFDTSASFIVPCRKGGYLVGLDQEICHFDWDSKAVTVLHKVDEGKNTRLNDAKCDSSGRLWCGTMGHETSPAKLDLEQGALYSLEVDGTLKQHKERVSISNGLAWTADNKTMYYIDSIPRKVFAYDFNVQAGTMENERVAVDFGDASIDELGYPDGMAIDTEDNLWVACYAASKVVRFDPVTGNKLSAIDLPARRITSCCFGGDNYTDMFVTCSAFGVTDEESVETPLAGSVFKVTGLGVKGTPGPVYEG